MDAQFQQWLHQRGLDQQQWSPELLQSLRARYEAEAGEVTSTLKGTYQVGKSTIPGAEVDRWRKLAAIPDHKILVDLRGCDWPQRCYRQEVTL